MGFARPAAARGPLPWDARAGVCARSLFRFRARAWAPVLGVLLAALSAFAATSPGTPIDNTAEGSYDPGAGGTTIGARSNTVTTIVAALTTFDPVRLAVSPAGAQAPGTMLTYTITAVNRSGIDLPDATFRLPLESDLLDPQAVPPGPVAPATTLAWDPASRTAVWTVGGPIRAGATITLSLRARIRPDATTDDTIVETADVVTTLSAAPVTSNTVVTPIVAPLLRLVKTADRRAAAPGDGVGYALEVAHVGTATPLHGIAAVDTLPPPLRYVPGTTRLDGLAAPDPSIAADGRTLRFALPDMAPGETHAIAFGARVGPDAREGDAVNHAYAEATTDGGNALVTPTSSAAVQIVPGPFRQEATLAGRVFVDDDRNGIPDPAEPGVPFALVVLEDGRAVAADVSGRWHMEGVRPGLHVARIDPDSLPPSLVPVSGGGDWAGATASRFVETRATGLAIADMPVGPPHVPRCTVASGHGSLVLPKAVLDDASPAGAARAGAVLEAAAAYVVDLGETSPGAVTLTCDDALPAERAQDVLRHLVAVRSAGPPDASSHGLRRLEPTPSDPSVNRGPTLSGVDGAASAVTGAASRSDAPSVPAGGAGTTPQGGMPAAPADALEDLVRHAASVAAIAYPADGSRAAREFTNVEVVYPLGSRVDLTLNGEPVPMALVGATSTLPARQLSASRFVGVRLRQGPNTLELRATPPGADPSSVVPVKVSIYLPGPTVQLAVATGEGRCVGDGVTPCAVRIEGLDEGGMRSGDEPLVTVVVEGAHAIDADADPRTEGLQVRLSQGLAIVRLTPPPTPGRIRVFAQHETATAEAFVDVVPRGGSWRVAGLAEGRLAGDAGVEGDGGLPPGVVDNISDSGGRVALFAQGPVLDDSHLTVAIDTDRRRDPYRLFDRFRPDLFFPVFGDSSRSLDEAARQGPFFVRFDGPAGFVAAGDFDTGFDHTELARYDRRLTGAWGRAGGSTVAVEAFAADTGQQAVRDTFSPDGTSGPYLLSKRPVVAYSESVIFEVRDRWRPEIVLRRIVKQPDLDYALDPDAGTILFRGPIAPFDADLNPIDVVVLYETRSGGADQIVAGARLTGHPTPQIDTGLTAIHEGHAGSDLDLLGLDVVWRARPGTTVAAETAASRQDDTTAVAYRFEAISQASDTLRWEAHYHDLPAGFVNPSFLSPSETGGQRASALVTWQASGPWRLKADALWQDDQSNNLTRTAGSAGFERHTDRFTFGGTVRGVSFDNAGASSNSLLLEAGVRGRLAPRWTGELFRAQVIAGEVTPGYPNRTMAGVTWEIKDGQRLVLKHEIESGGSAPTHARSIVGLESRIGANTRALVNYTLEGGATGTALRASTGIETVVPLDARSSLTASAAIVDTNRGDDTADFIALAGGYEYRAGSSLVSTRYEVNFNHVDVRHLLTAGGAFRMSDPWTLFVREEIFLSDPDNGATAARAEGLIGAAFRPASGPFQVLFRVDHTEAGGTPVTAGGVTPGGVGSQPAASIATPPRDPGEPGLGTDYARYGPLATRNAFAFNVAAGVRIDPRNRIAATLIVKATGREIGTGIPGSVTCLEALHYTAWVHPRWTVGASLRRFVDRESALTSYGHGVELGFLAIKNLWLTGGYNFAGFKDSNFTSAERTEQGPFLSIRFKFDEHSLATIKDLRLDKP